MSTCRQKPRCVTKPGGASRRLLSQPRRGVDDYNEVWTRQRRIMSGIVDYLDARHGNSPRAMFLDGCRWLRYRTIERFHIVQLRSLQPGYHEAHERILHAAFGVFEEFMDRQLSDKCIVDWDHESRREAWLEMMGHYDWWLWRKGWRQELDQLYRWPEVPTEWGELAMFDPTFAERSQVIEWKRIAAARQASELRVRALDDASLLRLINVRQYLWEGLH